jgi:hypothetical protein
MKHSLTLAVTAALSAGLLAACGTDATTSGSSQADRKAGSTAAPAAAEAATEPLDVCALLDRADLDRLFDDHFGEGELVHHEQTGGDQCVWNNGESIPVKQFSVTVWRQEARSETFADGDVTADKLWAAQKEYAAGAEPVDLGDDAYLEGTTLEVLDGTTIYTFTTGGGQSRMALDGMRELATTVVAG